MYAKFDKLLKKKGITPYRAAKEIGISSVVFTDWKKGKSSPKVDKLIKIANYLGVTLEELIKKDD